MIEEETLFVLGAGASKPYGYPTGENLREYICKQFPALVNLHYQYPESKYIFPKESQKHYEHEAEKLARVFFKSSTSSIDLFLSRNQSFNEIGKMAILAGILQSEQKSKFREEMEDKNQDWYSYLFKRLTNSLIKAEDYKDLGKNKVSFITFNYDRSLEQFLYESVVNSYYDEKLKDKIYTKQVSFEEIIPFPIIHVHGKVANLHWEGGIKYKKIEKIQIEDYVENIRIIFDKQNDEEVKQVRTQIKKAKRIFFIGFAYADENMEVLGIPDVLVKNQKIYGTAYGMTERERVDIVNKFKYNNPSPEINIIDSLALLKKYL